MSIKTENIFIGLIILVAVISLSSTIYFIKLTKPTQNTILEFEHKTPELSKVQEWTVHTNIEHGLSWQQPTSWPVTELFGNFRVQQNLGIVSSILTRAEPRWQLALGQKEKDGCEGEDCYLRFLTEYQSFDPGKLLQLMSDTEEEFAYGAGLISDSNKNGNRIIVYEEMAIAENLTGVIFFPNRVVVFSDKLGDRTVFYRLLESIVQAELKGWKTYHNKQHGFKLQYPEDWVVKENLYDFIVVIEPADEKYSVTVKFGHSEEEPPKGIPDYSKSVDVPLKNATTTASWVKKDFACYSAIDTEPFDCSEIIIPLERNGQKYELQTFGEAEEIIPEVYKQIFATFEWQ